MRRATIGAEDACETDAHAPETYTMRLTFHASETYTPRLTLHASETDAFEKTDSRLMRTHPRLTFHTHLRLAPTEDASET